MRPVKITRLSPVGFCIYCGSVFGLSDEHVIPLALGGDLILPKASCRQCTKITGAIEGAVLHDMLGAMRNKFDLPCRNMKKRPNALPIQLIGSGEAKQISIPVQEYPPLIVLPNYSLPGIMRGVSGELTPKIYWYYVEKVGQKEREEFITKYGKRVRIKYPLDNLSFARFLAKVAHSFCVAALGFPVFQSILNDFILGEDMDQLRSPFYYVGGNADNGVRPAEETFHAISSEAQTIGATEYILVKIIFFAHAGGPTYHIIVGTQPNQQ